MSAKMESRRMDMPQQGVDDEVSTWEGATGWETSNQNAEHAPALDDAAEQPLLSASGISNKRDEATSTTNTAKFGSKRNPKVKRTVEYRQEKDGTILYTRSMNDDQKARRHTTDVVFEIVDVNMTSETKDTSKGEDGTANDDPSNSIPIISYASRQLIRIHSHCILNALQAVVNYYPRHTIVGDKIELYEPYAILVNHWEELKEYRERFRPGTFAQNSNDCHLSDTYEHLGYMLDFLEETWGDKVRKEKERWAQEIPKATYEMLWLLLKPGIDVYYDVDRSHSREPYVVSHVLPYMYNKAIVNYEVSMWNLDGSDYRYIRPEQVQTTVHRFDGEKPIASLEVFPCQYQEGNDKRKAALIQRGQRFLELREKKCMYFDGETSTEPRRKVSVISMTAPPSNFKKYRGYVMVDPIQCEIDMETNTEYPIVDIKPSGTPYCFCIRCSNMETEAKKPAKFDGYMQINPNNMGRLTNHQYFICPRDIPAFVFHIREWEILFLDGFHEPKWNSGLFDNLVLKDNYKTLILNISKTFMNQKHAIRKKSHDATEMFTDDSCDETKSDAGPEIFQPWSADFIENKGKGLVFLLHGKPGVGKTYTAECIAEHIKRPLLPITCTDIGVNPVTVEENLVRWFKIAHNWDAVMLLDEADIYMEYRQIHDLTRNNLVASFLRAMEYYEGILFLTTNRVGTFDEAFLSRINLTIYYPDFQDHEREMIWNNYFDKLEREAGDQFYVSDSTKEYASVSEAVKQLKWNGREIRNAFQIAVNLAQAEGTKDKKGRFVVKRDHIKVTAELSKEFKNYMVSVHKKNESQRAQLMGYRYDAFNLPNVPKQDFI